MKELVTRIGKAATLLTTFFFMLVQSTSDTISVAAFDAQGREISTVALGIPFIIEIVVATELATSMPQLETDQAIQTTLQSSGSRIYTTNGVRTVTKNYRYRACAYQEGTFSIGPARIVIGGQDHTSSVKQLQVMVNEVAQLAPDKRAYIEIEVDKKRVVPGEPINFSLRLYMADDFVHIEGVNEPIFKDCTHGQLEGPISGNVEIDEVRYKYLEWKTTFYAHTPGTLIIPAVAAQVAIETRRSDQLDSSIDFFGMVNSLLGTHVERQQLISNGLKIEVAPFPAHEKKVTAFGSFSSLTAKANLESAAQSEGVVYTLELVGHGNFGMIGHPKLSLPEGLHYYESKASLHSLGAGISKKDFEYIIQGVEPGKYKIKPQELTFLDEHKRTYKTLTSKSVSLVITPAPMVAAAESVTALEQEDESNSTVQSGMIVEDLPALEEGTWQDVPLHPLSYTTFSTCLISLIILCIGLVVWNVSTTIRNIRKPERIRKNVLSDGYKQIGILEKKRNVQGLYPLWIHIFSVRKQIHIADISQEYISGVLYGAGFTKERLREWNEFFTAVMAANYSPEIEVVATDLFKESRIWLQRMEGIL